MASAEKKLRIGKLEIDVKLIICLAVIILLIIAVIIGSAKSKKKKEAAAIEAAGYTFDSTGFENITDIECLNEAVAVFTSDGKKGIMALDGTVTAEAEQDKVYLVSDAWRTTKIVCEGPLSEYRLVINPETGEITARQYQSTDTPEFSVIWNEEKQELYYYDGKEFTEAVKASDFDLEPGLYPVADGQGTGIKYGYVDDDLQLQTAMLYNGAKDFSEGLAAVNKNGNWGYIDEDGNQVIDCIYETIGDGAYSFRNGLAPVKKDGVCGLINKSGEQVITFDLDNILQGKDGKYIAQKDGVWGILTVNESVMAQVTTTAAETTGYAGEAGTYIIKTQGSSLNMRAEADGNSTVVAQIPNGTTVEIQKFSNGWAYTTYSSAQGWVSTEYIEKAPSTTTAQTSETDVNQG